MSEKSSLNVNPDGTGKNGALRLVERVGYGSGDFACSMYWVVFAQFLMYFYTDIAGLPAAAVGTMLAVTRLWDTINDPAMGLIADRTRSRHGRYRPWLIWMILPLIISGVLIFSIPDSSLTVKLIYAYVTYVLVGMVYTAVNLPYAALMGVMTSSSRERTILSSFRYMGSYTGNLVPQLTLFALVAWIGQGNEQIGFAGAMVVYGLLAGLLLIFTFRTTRERVLEVPSPEYTDPPDNRSAVYTGPAELRRHSIKTDLGYLFRNLPWIILAMVGVCTLVWISLRGASTIYYFKYYVGNQSLAGTFLAVGTVSMMAGCVCTKFIVDFFGDKKRAYIAVNLCAGLAAAAFYFLAPDQVFLIFLFQVVGSFLIGPQMPLMFALYADAADYGEWKFGRRTTGLIFASGTSAIKMGWTFGGAIAGWVLAYYGYEANVDQTEGSLFAIRSLMSWMPSLFAFVAMFLLFFYPISGEQEKVIAKELLVRGNKSA